MTLPPVARCARSESAHARCRRARSLGVDVEVILTRPCIFCGESLMNYKCTIYTGRWCQNDFNVPGYRRAPLSLCGARRSGSTSARATMLMCA